MKKNNVTTREISATTGRRLYVLMQAPTSGPHEDVMSGHLVTRSHAAHHTALFDFITKQEPIAADAPVVLTCEGASITDRFTVSAEADGTFTITHVTFKPGL